MSSDATQNKLEDGAGHCTICLSVLSACSKSSGTAGLIKPPLTPTPTLSTSTKNDLPCGSDHLSCNLLVDGHAPSGTKALAKPNGANYILPPRPFSVQLHCLSQVALLCKMSGTKKNTPRNAGRGS